MSIQDRDIRKALEVVTEEFENLEINLSDKEEEVEKLRSLLEAEETLNSRHEETIADLLDKVKELEEALAEAYLTDRIMESNE